jgi:hypothetical protein
MSSDPVDARREGYWDRVQYLSQPRWRQKRQERLAVEFYTALRAYEANPATPENPPSLVNWERSPTSDRTAETTADEAKSESDHSRQGGSPGRESVGESNEPTDGAGTELTAQQLESLKYLRQMGVTDVDRCLDLVDGDQRRHEAIRYALERDDERQGLILSLLARGEVAHACNLATCGRRSTQLQCGACESENNYVPMTCDSRLCPDCRNKSIGENIAKYENHIQEMDNPVLLTLTEQNFEDPITGRETLIDHFSKLRRRSIPLSGTTVRDGVEKSWCWWVGTALEDVDEDQEQWKVELQAQGEHDLVRRLQREYVDYEYEDITGTHVGRNIPFEELYEGGIYGIDIKQQGPFEYNVHVHVLIDMAYIPQAALSAVWEEITDGSPVVDVRAIYNRASDETIAEAIAETVGYAVKPPEFDDLDKEVEYATAVKGCASVHPFGDVHGLGSDSGSLVCCDCERTPQEWRYCGKVEGHRDTTKKTWQTKDPP